MTITIAWIRKNKNTSELLVASDSRLRSRGAIDQAQKVFPLDRGDCCLGFCGDTSVAYPLAVQVASTVNNFIKTCTRGSDFTDLVHTIRLVLNNLIASWDLDLNLIEEELSPNENVNGRAIKRYKTKILFAGWSWKYQRFEIGAFKFKSGAFEFHREMARLPHPWGQNRRSLIFLGDYENDYMSILNHVLRKNTERPLTVKKFLLNLIMSPLRPCPFCFRRIEIPNRAHI